MDICVPQTGLCPIFLLLWKLLAYNIFDLHFANKKIKAQKTNYLAQGQIAGKS